MVTKKKAKDLKPGDEFWWNKFNAGKTEPNVIASFDEHGNMSYTDPRLLGTFHVGFEREVWVK